MIQLLYVLVMLNQQPCEIPTTLTYNDTLMYIRYDDVVETYRIKDTIKKKWGGYYIVLDNGLCRMDAHVTHIVTNSGHELVLRPLREPREFHELVSKYRHKKVRKFKEANAT